MTTKAVASLSLDLDNLWSYMKTHGDPGWRSLPTYIPTVVPRLLDLFTEFDVHSTVFVVGQDTEIDENAESLASIAAAGHELGNHSFRHEPWLHRYSRDELVEELCRTAEGIKKVAGQWPTGFRGPGYSLSQELLDVLAELGYRYDCSTLPTWIGPLARAYYFRSAKLEAEQREERKNLFGSARDGLRPIRPYRWGAADGVIEIPVTTTPLVRTPMHVSYVLYLHGISPLVARAYFRSALRLCAVRRIGPSILLHPLDLLDDSDAPGIGFFPGMGLPAARKLDVVRWCLSELSKHFEVVGTGTHARALADASVTRSRQYRS